MRRLFTTGDAYARGLTPAGLRWGERKGRWRRLERGVYIDGPEEASEIDRQRARILAAGAVGSNQLAGVLHGLDGVVLEGRPAQRRVLPDDRIESVGGIACTDALQTLIDLAAVLDDPTWEQALDSALRMGLTTISEIEAALPALSRSRTRGTARLRRVLARRPPRARPTGSLLETLMVQLARTVPGLGEPERQYFVEDSHGYFIAIVDLVWLPPIGLFVDLDGQQHRDQPVYDARRETAVVAATGWLPGRFTWREVVHLRATTSRRLRALADQARRRSPTTCNR